MRKVTPGLPSKVPNFLRMSRKPRVYFAGKIGRNDWRHRIVPNLCGSVTATDASEEKLLFDPSFVLDCKFFNYGGPFRVSANNPLSDEVL
jgi:hypothetical protein